MCMMMVKEGQVTGRNFKKAKLQVTLKEWNSVTKANKALNDRGRKGGE